MKLQAKAECATNNCNQSTESREINATEKSNDVLFEVVAWESSVEL